MKPASKVSIWIVVLGFGLTASAQEATRPVEVHGFGGWGYGNSDGNSYLWGTDKGSYRNAEFTLSLSAAPQEKLTVYAQVRDDRVPGGWETNVDYAFAQWTFSDALRLRIGRIRQPFGIYTEISHVGTLRPFLQLPQSVYGPAGFVAEGVDGAGITGARFFRGGWSLQYDLYGGQIVSVARNPLWNFPAMGSVDVMPLTIESDARDAYGGRLVVRTPLQGLSFGVSGYNGKQVEDLEGTLPPDAKNWSLGGQVEYVTDALSVRGEYLRHSVEEFVEVEGWYGEVAYKFTRNWQGALRYDHLKMDLPPALLGMMPPGLTDFFRHHDTAAALNYWFTTNFVIKLEYHQVEGNYFATPGDPFGAYISGTLNNRTDLFQFGAQFSF